MNQTWIEALEQLGFDVTRRDPLIAHKEYGSHKAVDVQVDKSGQVRLTITASGGDTQAAKRAAPSGRQFQIFTERNLVTIVNYRMLSDDDLASVVREMELEATR